MFSNLDLKKLINKKPIKKKKATETILSLFLYIFAPRYQMWVMDDLLRQYIDYLRFEKRASEHTVVSYQTDLEQFCVYLSENGYTSDLSKVAPEPIRAWVIQLVETGVTARSVSRKLSALRSFYRYHARVGNVENSPMEQISAPKVSKKLPCFVEEKAMENLFQGNLFTNDYHGWRDRTIIELFYATGIRISELANLTFASVNLYNNTIKVLGKRNKERIVPFGDTFKTCYQSYVNYYDEKFAGHTENCFIFVTDKQNKIYPKFVYAIVRNYLDMVTAIDKRSPHVLRHTFATHLLNHGADINAIKEILGHSSLAATQVYTHNSIEKLKSIYQTAHPRA